MEQADSVKHSAWACLAITALKAKPSPADAPLRHFEMEVIGVERVVVRAEHGGEEAAGALVYVR